MNKHGSVIKYEDIDNIISDRIKWIPSELKAPVDAAIANKQPLHFLPTSLVETHYQDAAYAASAYKIVLFGILQDGRKVNVLINGILPYFDVLLGEKTITDVKKLFASDISAPCKYEEFTSRTFKYYNKPQPFVRLYFTKLQTRKEALKIVQNTFTTATDDTSSYYRVVCRDECTTFSSWATLTNYNATNHKRLRGDTYIVDISNYKPFAGELPTNMLKDRTMSLSWDIETYAPDHSVPVHTDRTHCIFCISLVFSWVNEGPFYKIALQELPSAPRSEHLTVVCGNERNLIAAFAQFISLLKPEFIIGFNDSDYDWPWLVNRAKVYKGLLAEMATLMDCSVPFYPHTDDTVFTRVYKKSSVKLEATNNADGYAMYLPGYIPIDLRTVFRKLYPTAEKSSLSFFLEMNKLGGKEDMPYNVMFEIYEKLRALTSKYRQINCVNCNISKWDVQDAELYTTLHERLGLVNLYCVVDAQRCHELMKIRSVIMDHREVANLSYCSVEDAFYKANGMKVRNLTIARGQQAPFNIRFTTVVSSYHEEGKYPGAYVFPPRKGLIVTKPSIDELKLDDETKQQLMSIITSQGKAVIDAADIETSEIQLKNRNAIEWLESPIGRPIIGLDFSSLYPSVIRCYNFSPEYCITDRAQARALHATGQHLTKVDFEFNGTRRIAWFVWHNNAMDPASDDFQFGVYPYILDDLFKRRASIKAQMKKFDHRKEEIESMSKEEQYIVREEYADVIFNRNYLNSKQNALKVFMNTFYGEAGNKNSPFFVLELAGGITSYGKSNIRLAQAKVEDAGCTVFYGDTDSLYISTPEKDFAALDVQYYTGCIDKLHYWTELVRTAFIAINPIRDVVNDMFRERTNTNFLSMAYEEVLYPVAFTAKKKYYGIAHESIPNFSPKDLFIRGLEVKKRGVSEILRKIFYEIMWASCSVENTKTLYELTISKIDDIYSRKWDPTDFIQTGVYKLNKNNVKLHTLARRYKEAGIELKPNERFNYVIVKKYPWKYDLRGRKIPLDVGDKIELDYIARDSNLEIDLDYYMSGSINGQLARLITYHPQFAVDASDDSEEALAVAETRIYKNATKHIEDYCSKYYAQYTAHGKVHQRIYKTVSSNYKEQVAAVDKTAASILFSSVDTENFVEWLQSYVEKTVNKDLEKRSYGSSFVATRLNAITKEVRSMELPTTEAQALLRKKKADCIVEMQRAYYVGNHSIIYTRESNYELTRNIILSDLRTNLPTIMKLFNYSTSVMSAVVERVRKQLPANVESEGSSDEIDVESLTYDMEDMQLSDYRDNITVLRRIYQQLIACYCAVAQTRLIVANLKERRDVKLSLVEPPQSDASIVDMSEILALKI